MKEHGILLFALMSILCLFPAELKICAAVVLLVFFFVRTKKAAVLPLILFSAVCVPRWSGDMPEEGIYRTVSVHAGYSILQKGRTRILAYHTEPFLYDSDYWFDGACEPVSETYGFFRFRFSSYLRQEGTLYSADSSHFSLVKENTSVLHGIQKCIDRVPEELHEVLSFTLLNIRPKDSAGAILYDYGFSVTAAISVIDRALSRFLDRKKRKRVITVITALFAWIYHFPITVMNRLILLCAQQLYKEQKDAVMPSLCILLCIFPQAVFRGSFWIPAVIRICRLTGQRSFSERTLYLSFVNLILYKSINPAVTFLFPYIRKAAGIVYYISLCTLLVPGVFGRFLLYTSTLSNHIAEVSVTSSPAGAGLPLYVMLYTMCAHNKYSSEIRLAMLIGFCMTGLFHPLGEVTFINVGQGDSILIKEPFGGKTYMIDTGKPAQYGAVQDYLNAKGIRRIDTLFITHDDSDHSGNMERIQEDYSVKHLVTEHFDTYQTGKIVFSDLNRLTTEDENQSSIVHWFTIAGLNILCMGDSDQAAEEQIIREYGDLPCDVLKLSHHGSNTGSGDRFLDSVKPKTAIISSGAYSIYHHPAPEVIDRLAKRHIPWFDTKEEGDISIFFFCGLRILVTSRGTAALL